MQTKFGMVTRGGPDNWLAGLANSFNISCPQCEKVGKWGPFPEENTTKVVEKQSAL